MPAGARAEIPSELLEQLPRCIAQSSFYDEKLAKLAQDCGEDEDEEAINNDHVYSERYLCARASI